MDLPERIATFAGKVGIVVGAGTAGVSWLEKVPPGVVAGIGVSLLGVAVQVFFRYLSDRRERQKIAFERELRLIEHDLYKQRYSQPPTQPVPLEDRP